MKEIELPPRAAALSESMRDIGYSLESAVADIVDNSISARASHVSIFFDSEGTAARLGILDDGHGMNSGELIEAMRCGTHNPRTQRTGSDLGRFGLGLKTASFSQCTKITVVTRQGRSRNGAVWDLDVVGNRDEWLVLLLDEDEIDSVPYVDRLEENGTLVLWERLDRLCEGNPETVSDSLIYTKIGEVEKHLSLVFHRYLGGEVRGRTLKISINGHQLEGFDPFCISNKATQLLNQEIIRMNGEEVLIQPYILPHHSRLSPREREFYRDRSDFLNNQGAYVYRNSRLMAWGDWFRLATKGEATKLARVRIDFPSTLDEQWTIDIKKSRAYPPLQVREQLKKIIGRIAESSIRVHSRRGRRLFEKIPKPVWIRTAADGGIRYSIDREHPVVSALLESSREDEARRLREAISVIENSVPVEAIYADYSVNPQEFETAGSAEAEDILERLENIWSILADSQDVSRESFLEVVGFLRPFSEHPALIEKFLKEKLNDDE